MRRFTLALGIILLAASAFGHGRHGRNVSFENNGAFGDCNGHRITFDGERAAVVPARAGTASSPTPALSTRRSAASKTRSRTRSPGSKTGAVMANDPRRATALAAVLMEGAASEHLG